MLLRERPSLVVLSSHCTWQLGKNWDDKKSTASSSSMRGLMSDPQGQMIDLPVQIRKWSQTQEVQQQEEYERSDFRPKLQLGSIGNVWGRAIRQLSPLKYTLRGRAHPLLRVNESATFFRSISITTDPTWSRSARRSSLLHDLYPQQSATPSALFCLQLDGIRIILLRRLLRFVVQKKGCLVA